MQHQITTSQEALIERFMALGCNLVHVRRLEKSWGSPLRVAFGGKTNAGKTTTVQALLAMMATDAEVKRTLTYFPVDVLSSTACPVVIGHSEQIAITTHFRETSKHSSDLSVLRDLKIPENPDSDWSAPVWAEVYLPIDGLKRFQLCDTAGIGTVGEDFTKEQWGQVRKWASLVVWLTSDVPGDLELARISEAIKSGCSVWLGRTCMDRIKWGQNPDSWSEVLRQCDTAIDKLSSSERSAVRLPTLPLQSILASNVELGTGDHLLSKEDVEHIKTDAWELLGKLGHRTPLPTTLSHLHRATLRELRALSHGELSLETATARLRHLSGIDDLIRRLELEADCSARKKNESGCLEDCVFRVLDRVEGPERESLLNAVCNVIGTQSSLPRLAWRYLCQAGDELLRGDFTGSKGQLEAACRFGANSIETKGLTLIAQAFLSDVDQRHLTQFQKLLTEKHDCVTALCGEAMGLIRADIPASALQSAITAAELAPDFTLVKFAYAWSALQMDDFSAAAQVLSEPALLELPLFRILASSLPRGCLDIDSATIDLNEAISNIEALLKIHSSSGFLRQFLALGNSHLGVAAPHYADASSESPVGALIDQAEQLESEGKWQDAALIWQTVCQMNPIAHNQYRLGNACKEADRIEDATRFLRIAFESDPGNQDYVCRYASVLLLNEHRDQAIDVYETAVAVSPSDSVLHHNLAYVLARAGYCDRAKEHARQALELEWSDDTHGLLVDMCYATNDFPEARQLLLTGMSNDPQAAIRAATIAASHHDCGTALRICQNLQDKGLRDDEAVLLHGLCLFNLGAFQEAWNLFVDSINIDTPDYRHAGMAGKSVLFAMANDQLARSHPNPDRLQDAVRYLKYAVERSLELQKGDFDFLFHLGCAHYYCGQLQEAEKAFERVCQLDSFQDCAPFTDNSPFLLGASPREISRRWSWAEAYFSLGMTKTRLGKDKEAREAFSLAAINDIAHYNSVQLPTMGMGGFLGRLFNSSYDGAVHQNIPFLELNVLRYTESLRTNS